MRSESGSCSLWSVSQVTSQSESGSCSLWSVSQVTSQSIVMKHFLYATQLQSIIHCINIQTIMCVLENYDTG